MPERIVISACERSEDAGIMKLSVVHKVDLQSTSSKGLSLPLCLNFRTHPLKGLILMSYEGYNLLIFLTKILTQNGRNKAEKLSFSIFFIYSLFLFSLSLTTNL